VPLYPPLPLAPSFAPSLLTPDGESWGTVVPVKSGLEASGASTPLTSLSPMDLMPTPSLTVLTLRPPFNQGIQPVPMRTPVLLRLPPPCRCPWGRSEAQCIMTGMVKYKEEDRHSSTSPLPP
jgi:hypothetical protein